MNIPARLGSSNFPTRLVHALATALLLAACHSGPKRLDELAISRLRPGQTRYEDVVRELDIDPQRDAAFPSHERGAREEFTFGPEWHEWAFGFDPAGVLQTCSRVLHGCTFAFDSEEEADEWQAWFDKEVASHPVDPSRAAEFVPGKTTQADVIAAWGACVDAGAIASGGFTMCWGANNDSWSLEFDPSGVLASAPQHYASDSLRN